MILLVRENGSLKIFGDTYNLEFVKDRPFVYLYDHRSRRVAELFVLSAIHPLDGRDDTTGVQEWRIEETLSEVVVSLDISSSVWQSKTVRFRCHANRFQYDVEVNGQGQIAEAVYFGGYSSAHLRWGSGFFWSGQQFQQGFNPEPNSDEVYYFPSDSNSVIDMTGVPLPGRTDWFFTPPPFCFAVQTQAGWMGLGIEARPGENRFGDFAYHGRRNAFYLSMSYDGQTRVDGRYRLPAVAFDFGSDPYTLLAMHVQHLRFAGLAPIPGIGSRPAWWSEPIFCGWGSQCYLARSSGGGAPDYATQASYEDFLHTLANHGVYPGTVVIDDKWQLSYGENQVDPGKWPDLVGFIHSRHAEGQHILLWLKAWDPQGIPPEECITNAAGLPVSVDPTNPVFEKRLRDSVRRMLTPDGYDADGFKIDFSARIPSGPGMQHAGDAWGLELMHLYLSIIRDEARRVKPDAFIITHTPHPYLADLVDAIRLNDINTRHDVARQMSHRARVAAIACPEALIDMDNWPISGKAGWKEYLSLRPFLGIPALYFASHIDSTEEPLDEEDYALIRNAWQEYRKTVAERRRSPLEKITDTNSIILADRRPLVKHLPISTVLLLDRKPLKTPGKDPLHGLN